MSHNEFYGSAAEHIYGWDVVGGFQHMGYIGGQYAQINMGQGMAYYCYYKLERVLHSC
jgi:hypothetical protein